MGIDNHGKQGSWTGTLVGQREAAGFASERGGRIGQPLISSSIVGSTNRGRVLESLLDFGPTSRAELARLAGVNRATISGIVQPLIDEGVLVEIDAVPANSNGGKPAKPLWFSPSARPICGVLLMPDVVHACLTTLDGHILAEEKRALPTGRGPVEPIIELVAESVGETLRKATRPPLGMGVAVGGMVDTDRGSIVAINLAPRLDGYPLAEELRRRFDMPVLIDHHPRALLVGDRWFGPGRGARQFAVVYTGEVLGGAFYLDGHLYRGAAGAGGELGHTFVQLGGDLCRCGRRGCWETIATLGWLRRQAAEAGLQDAEAMDSARLVALAEAGQPGAGELLDRYAHNLAVGIANLQQVVAPNLYILHGDVVLGGERLIAAVAAHVREMLPPRPGGEIELIAGDAGDQAALVGAAGLVLSDRLQFPI